MNNPKRLTSPDQSQEDRSQEEKNRSSELERLKEENSLRYAKFVEKLNKVSDNEIRAALGH